MASPLSETCTGAAWLHGCASWQKKKKNGGNPANERNMDIRINSKLAVDVFFKSDTYFEDNESIIKIYKISIIKINK